MRNSAFVKLVTFLFCWSTGFIVNAQTAVEPDLAKLFQSGVIKTYNRTATLTQNDQKESVIHLNEMPDSGVAWLTGISFTTGTIEFDVKGRNLLQRSFVGIAFHGTDSVSYDAIYFRPFNFKSVDKERQSHAVQYISLPANDWPKLREQHPNEYEKAVDPVPEPDEWFHAKIEVNSNEVKVFVNNSAVPSLVVRPLNNQPADKIGFWVGAGSSGDFSNLKISNKPESPKTR